MLSMTWTPEPTVHTSPGVLLWEKRSGTLLIWRINFYYIRTYISSISFRHIPQNNLLRQSDTARPGSVSHISRLRFARRPTIFSARHTTSLRNCEPRSLDLTSISADFFSARQLLIFSYLSILTGDVSSGLKFGGHLFFHISNLGNLQMSNKTSLLRRSFH
jgi:hypothetical protein